MQTPTPNEIATARRVLEAIMLRRTPFQADALVLRLWMGTRMKMRLEDIAMAIIEAEYS
jgi:hypothetical protein